MTSKVDPGLPVVLFKQSTWQNCKWITVVTGWATALTKSLQRPPHGNQEENTKVAQSSFHLGNSIPYTTLSSLEIVLPAQVMLKNRLRIFLLWLLRLHEVLVALLMLGCPWSCQHYWKNWGGHCMCKQNTSSNCLSLAFLLIILFVSPPAAACSSDHSSLQQCVLGKTTQLNMKARFYLPVIISAQLGIYLWRNRLLPEELVF